MVILKGKDAKKFIKQDRKPLSDEKKTYLKKCLNIYKNNPVIYPDTYEVDDPQAVYGEDWNDKGSIFPPLNFCCISFLIIIVISVLIVFFKP